jgi:hypothetical protein
VSARHRQKLGERGAQADRGMGDWAFLALAGSRGCRLCGLERCALVVPVGMPGEVSADQRHLKQNRQPTVEQQRAGGQRRDKPPPGRLRTWALTLPRSHLF